MTQNSEHSVPMATLEVIMRRNKAASDNLFAEAMRIREENKYLEAEVKKLSTAPPPSAPQAQEPKGPRLTTEQNIVRCAVRLVRSWDRRGKKYYTSAEEGLLDAVRQITAKDK